VAASPDRSHGPGDGSGLRPCSDLLPTILDMPPMQIAVLEYADPNAPYGLRGVGEPPTISSGPAVANAIRQAVGKPLPRVPIRPEHITGT